MQTLRRTILFSLPLVGLLVTGAVAATAAGETRVTRAAILSREKALDDKIRKLWDDNPYVLPGETRGVYLDGFGVVFTADVLTLVRNQPLMGGPPNADEKVQYRLKKQQRIVQLKNLLKTALVDAASQLEPLPVEEQVANGVSIYKYPWEDSAGMPSHVMVRGQKKRLLEVKSAPAAIDLAVKLTEE